VAISSLLWRTGWPALPGGDVGDTVLALGRSLVNPDQCVIPFEVASVLLIVALIGSIAVALPGKQSE
jgi:NADH:ubiquinone oxidoreductase subunit 6 (subunit J)